MHILQRKHQKIDTGVKRRVKKSSKRVKRGGSKKVQKRVKFLITILPAAAVFYYGGGDAFKISVSDNIHHIINKTETTDCFVRQ